MNKSKGTAGTVLLVVVAILIVACAAFYVGKNSNSSQKNEVSIPISTTNTSTNNTTESPYLILFTGSKGNFSAQSHELTSVNVYYVPTGTATTQSKLLGTMTLNGTNGNVQTWSLP